MKSDNEDITPDNIRGKYVQMRTWFSNTWSEIYGIFGSFICHANRDGGVSYHFFNETRSIIDDPPKGSNIYKFKGYSDD